MTIENNNDTLNNKQAPSRTKKILVLGLATLALILLSVGIYLGYRYMGSDVNGKWTSPKLQSQFKAHLVELEDDDYYKEMGLDLNDLFTKPRTSLSVKKDKAVLIYSITFDRDLYFKTYKAHYEELAAPSLEIVKDITDPELKAELEASNKELIPDQDETNQWLDEWGVETASEFGGFYDKQTATLTIPVVRGKVNRLTQTIELTYVSDEVGLNHLRKGQKLPLTKKGSRLIFEGKTEAKDLTFKKE